MNHTTQNASFAIVLCRRFTAYLTSSLKAKGFTAQIIRLSSRALNRGLIMALGFGAMSSYATRLVIKAGHFYRLPILRSATYKFRNAGLTCTYADSLDTPGTLQARAHQGLTPGRLRLARGVAFVIGISLSIPMASADSGSIEAIEPKRYIRLALDKREAICLSRLIGKESAWDSKAIGNLGSPTKQYVYGLLQLKNPIVKDKTPIEQIHYGLKYINHRYEGDTCKAWKHWKDKGWH